MPADKSQASKYQDLDVLQRENRAKRDAQKLGKLNILRDDPPVRAEITKTDLSKIGDLLSNVNRGATLIFSLLPMQPVIGLRSPAEATAVTQEASKVVFRLDELKDIFEDLAKPENLKSINPKEWNKVRGKFSAAESSVAELRRIIEPPPQLAMGVGTQRQMTASAIAHIWVNFEAMAEAYDGVDQNVGTFGGSRKSSGPDPMSVERKLR